MKERQVYHWPIFIEVTHQELDFLKPYIVGEYICRLIWRMDSCAESAGYPVIVSTTTQVDPRYPGITMIKRYYARS